MQVTKLDMELCARWMGEDGAVGFPYTTLKDISTQCGRCDRAQGATRVSH